MALVTSLSGPYNLFGIFSLLFLVISMPTAHCSGGVFRVQRKLVSNHLAVLERHDHLRHARLLSDISAVDIPIGSAERGVYYYTNIKIGTPPKNYTVHIDTGSHVLWVNCKGCIGCYPNDDARGSALTPYDPKNSETAEIIRMGEDRCNYPESQVYCKRAPIPFHLQYVGGTEVEGYYVSDLISYDEVVGDHLTQMGQGNVTFGCVDLDTSKHPSNFTGNPGIDGLIGFGYSNRSMIFQLASAGKVRREFAHCFNNEKGGLFAIGHVVKPKVKMTPFDPSAGGHYNARMTSVQVGDKFVNLDSIGVDGVATIDTGTSLGILPNKVYNYILENAIYNRPHLHVVEEGNFKCFNYSGNPDDEFPTITFHFLQSVTLKVHPHDYLRPIDDDIKYLLCFLWNSGQKFNDTGFILGNIAMTNKLIVYDLENATVGFTDYDCTSSIEVEDDQDRVCTIHAHKEAISNPPPTN